jgi:hypothetical protein
MVKAVDQEEKTAPVPLVAPIVLASYVKSVFLWFVVLEYCMSVFTIA